MSTSALWTFAHRALAPLFHEDASRFIATLDGNAAPQFLEHFWQRALQGAGAAEPANPPLRYGIDKPRPGLVIVWMTFSDVKHTGEPWQARFIMREPDADGQNGYHRVFFLEHSEYASELEKKPVAIVCESEAGGRHRNWGATFPPDDEQSFDNFVVGTLQQTVTAKA